MPRISWLRNVGVALVLLCASTAQAQGARCESTPWWLWSTFKQHFIQPDGRVTDASTAQLHSSSEGQSYAMFFALVANDPATFERLWRWSVNNLAGGDIKQQLPAWFWGRREDDTWGVLDSNSAADADLWFVYSLLEAGKRWQREDYIADARQLLSQIEQREIVQLPGFGYMLLPGVNGFLQANDVWVLNPSYLPLPVVRRLKRESAGGPWAQIAALLPRLIHRSSPQGFAPDWIGYQGLDANQGQFVASPLRGGVGSYDAIRTYLWAGISSADDPATPAILHSLYGMLETLEASGLPPEKVTVSDGASQGPGPFGFSAAVVPYLQALGKPELAEVQQRRALEGINTSLTPERLKQAQPPYYDFVLSLFALGFAQQRYAFRADGGIDLKWEELCSQAAGS